MSIVALLQTAVSATPRDEVYLFVALGLLALALVLLVLELFVPTGGALSIMTGVAAVASIASMFIYDTVYGAVYLALLCAGSPLVLLLVFKVWSHTPIARRMILQQGADGATQSDRMQTESGDPSVASRGKAAAAMTARLSELVGRGGTAVTTLRPVGFVRVEGQRIDAIAESGFIAEGAAVDVIEVFEGQLKVRERRAE
ncbi:MAG: NfeD family protein [Planctomycetota bacterium]